MFCIYSRKVNDSNTSANNRTEEAYLLPRHDLSLLIYQSRESLQNYQRINKICPLGSIVMCLTNIEEITHDHRLFVERICEKEYTWLYYNLNEKDYLSKILNVFYGESNAKPGDYGACL